MAEENANLSEHQEVITQNEEQNAQEQAAPIEISDEQFQAYLKSRFQFSGDIENLKQKLEYTPPAPEPTDEEKTATERAEEKKLLEKFQEINKGTVEQFASMKSVLKMDDLEVGKNAAIRELVDLGFSKEEAEAEFKHRYYQQELTELNEDDFDSKEDYEAAKATLQKKIDLGKKKLANKSAYIKKELEGVFKGLKQAIEQEDLQKQKEIALSSKVDEYVSKLPRKMTLQLGESNGRKLDPVDYDVSDKDIADVAETLKNPSKRNEVLFDKDGNVNISTVAELMLRNKILESAVKASYLTGETRQVEVYERINPARSPYQLGVGGVPQKKSSEPGKITKIGAPRVVQHS